MKNKLLSVLLACSLTVTMIAGCGSTGTESKDSNETSTDSTSAEGADEDVAEVAPAEIDMDEEPYEVAIQLVTLPGTDYSAYEAEMEEKINEITVPAINAKLDIQFVWINEIANKTSLAVAGNEKLDLVHVATVSPLSSMVGADMLYDMNEDDLLKTHGQTLVSLFSDILEAGEVDGQQLAVPAKLYNAVAKGLDYNKTAAENEGVDIPATGNLEDLDKALTDLKNSGSDIIGWYAGEGTNNYLYWLEGYESFGTNASYGAVLDAAKDTTVVNLYDTEDFLDYALLTYKWRQDGIIRKDSTDNTSAQDYFNAQQIFCYPGDLTPQLDANYSATAKNNGFELGTMQMVEPKITNASVTEYMWGIAVNSERPDKAMDMLNFIYENADVANILMYGLEGTNYEFVEGSDKVIETNGSYIAAFVQIGNPENMLIQSPAGEDYYEQWEAFSAKATTSPIVGYMFSDADYQTESAAITNVINQYMPTLMNGSCESEDATKAYVEEFVSALEAAGMNDVIAGNQEQLDAYLARQ